MPLTGKATEALIKNRPLLNEEEKKGAEGVIRLQT